MCIPRAVFWLLSTGLMSHPCGLLVEPLLAILWEALIYEFGSFWAGREWSCSSRGLFPQISPFPVGEALTSYHLGALSRVSQPELLYEFETVTPGQFSGPWRYYILNQYAMSSRMTEGFLSLVYVGTKDWFVQPLLWLAWSLEYKKRSLVLLH